MIPDRVMDPSGQVKPFDQRIRITALRLCFVALLPVLVLTHSGWLGSVVAPLLETGGVLMIFLAVLGRFWSILYIGGRKNAEVMRDGPYSICRHPLYLFSTMGVVGFGLMLGSLVLAGAMGGLAWAILSATAAREERFLRHRFGARYDSYARQVPRMWPDLRLFSTPPEVVFDSGTLARNAADALVFLSLIPLADLLRGLQTAAYLPSLPLF